MSELLGKNEQLTVRDFQILRGRCDSRAIAWCRFGFGPHQLDPDRNTLLQFNLSNGDRSIWAIEYAFNQASLGVAGTVYELWHRRGKISRNLKSQIGICFAGLNGYKVKRIFSERCNVSTNHESGALAPNYRARAKI